MFSQTSISNEEFRFHKVFKKDFFVEHFGNVNYQAFKTHSTFLYSYDLNLASNINNEEIIEWLADKLTLFQTCLWFVKDNAVSSEDFYFYNEFTYSCTIKNGLLKASMADGSTAVVKFSVDEINRALEYYKLLIEKIAIKSPDDYVLKVEEVKGKEFHSKEMSRIHRSINFISLARSQRNMHLKIAFYCSALECLFSTDSTEIVHKLSERIARFLGSGTHERLKIYKNIKKAYSVRSAVMHGSAYKHKVCEEKVKTLDNYVRAVFLKILDDKDVYEESIFHKDEQDMNLYFEELILS